MTYNIKQAIESYGKEKIKHKILCEGISQIEIHKELKLSTSDRRINAGVYTRIYSYLGIDNIPYASDTPNVRKFKLEFDKVNGNYWESEYIVDYLINKLNNPISNISDGAKRYVISFPKHPKANSISNQIKAHIVLWELLNEQYVPEDCWVIPKDGNYTNLAVDNLILVNTSVYKSSRFFGENNPAFKHGLSLRPKLGGWSRISKEHLQNNNICKYCAAQSDLVVHHIINYHLFNDPIKANIEYNLLTLCRSCHTKLHAYNTNIKALIEATQYSKLLELLETLKSQVPDSRKEILLDVEKQLGLTDNQQPST